MSVYFIEFIDCRKRLDDHCSTLIMTQTRGEQNLHQSDLFVR